MFRSARSETMPLLDERLAALHQTGNILLEHYGGSFENVVRAARGSATQLVKTIVKQFPAFRDESEFLGEPGVSDCAYLIQHGLAHPNTRSILLEASADLCGRDMVR